MKFLKNFLSGRSDGSTLGTRLIYDFCADSHRGLLRSINEDSYLALPEHGLWIVADGMGGHDQGERASRIAVQEIAKGMLEGKTLRDSIHSAHVAIRDAGGREAGGTAMGTTVVVARLVGLHYQIAWVGDSRAYVWDTSLRQLTIDHSYVQMLLNAGMLTREEAFVHPKKNVLLHALGLPPEANAPSVVDYTEGTLRIQDTLLLCSDGLHGEISDEQIKTILSCTDNNTLLVKRLTDAALQAGGRDNITIIAISPVRLSESSQR